MLKKRTILDLDDYSLGHLFSFLPVMDLATIGYTCPRFKLMIGSLISGKRISYSCLHWTDESATKKFFIYYGAYIKEIDISYDHNFERFIEFIPRFCHNIEAISFYRLKSHFILRVLASNKNIKMLNVYTDDVGDHECQFICRLKNLQRLNLYSFSLTGEHLDRLTKLKELCLDGCSQLDSKHFIGICKATKLLRLKITGCQKLNMEAFRTLVATQTELEDINVEDWYKDGDVQQVALLPSLRNIHILYQSGLSRNPVNLIRKLSEHCSSSLKGLIISCAYNNPPFNDLERISKFENLEVLHLRDVIRLKDSDLICVSKVCKQLQRISIGACSRVTNEGVLQLVRNLKCLRFLNLERCIYLGGELYQKMCEAKRTLDNKIQLEVYAPMSMLIGVTDEQHRMSENLVRLFYNKIPYKGMEVILQGPSEYTNSVPPVVSVWRKRLL